MDSRAGLTNRPRAHTSTLEIERRNSALSDAHMRPLSEYVGRLRSKYPSLEFPDFDPLGGGIDADMLFLLEKPGPKTSRRGGGSGFVSACNDDPTAEASWHFMQEAGIDLERTCHWNIIPGWDGNREQRSQADVSSGLSQLEELLGLLPKLRVAVLLGNKAHKAEALLRDHGLHVVKTIHPSRLARASYPDRWKRLGAEWAKARELADCS